jgi:hypothetical protein
VKVSNCQRNCDFNWKFKEARLGAIQRASALKSHRDDDFSRSFSRKLAEPSHAPTWPIQDLQFKGGAFSVGRKYWYADISRIIWVHVSRAGGAHP